MEDEQVKNNEITDAESQDSEQDIDMHGNPIFELHQTMNGFIKSMNDILDNPMKDTNERAKEIIECFHRYKHGGNEYEEKAYWEIMRGSEEVEKIKQTEEVTKIKKYLKNEILEDTPDAHEYLIDLGFIKNDTTTTTTDGASNSELQQENDTELVDFNTICAKYNWKNLFNKIAQLDDAYDFKPHILHNTIFEIGTINYIVARPADGKTTTLVSLALDAIRHQNAGKKDKQGNIIPRRKVFIISAEEGAHRFLMRLIRNEAYYRYLKETRYHKDNRENATHENGLNTDEYNAVKEFITNPRNRNFNPTWALVDFSQAINEGNENWGIFKPTKDKNLKGYIGELDDKERIDKKENPTDDDKEKIQALHKVINLVYAGATKQIRQYYNDGEIVIIETAKDLNSTDRIRQFIDAIPPRSIVLIDYVQRLKNGNDYLESGNTRYVQIKEISDMLAETAKDKDLITIAGAQLNRNADPYELDYSNIRESGDLEQDAFVITGLSSFFAYEENVGNDDPATRMNYMQNLKNRTGELDNRCFFVNKDRLGEMLAYSYIDYTDEGTIDSKKGTYGQKEITILIKEVTDWVTNTARDAFKLFSRRGKNEDGNEEKNDKQKSNSKKKTGNETGDKGTMTIHGRTLPNRH